MSKKITPCPHCGGKALFRRVNPKNSSLFGQYTPNMKGYVSVSCESPDCGAGFSFASFNNTELDEKGFEVMEKWERRS